jgi:hypothetical protein
MRIKANPDYFFRLSTPALLSPFVAVTQSLVAAGSIVGTVPYMGA